MRRVRIEMLKSRDQLQARECYNLPLDMAAELIAHGEARDLSPVRPKEQPVVGPSEIKPFAPSELKKKKLSRRTAAS